MHALTQGPGATQASALTGNGTDALSVPSLVLNLLSHTSEDDSPLITLVSDWLQGSSNNCFTPNQWECKKSYDSSQLSRPQQFTYSFACIVMVKMLPLLASGVWEVGGGRRREMFSLLGRKFLQCVFQFCCALAWSTAGGNCLSFYPGRIYLI